jgi:hypothetical protein
MLILPLITHVLLQSTRETTGLVLKDNIIIIDEVRAAIFATRPAYPLSQAHNLLDTIASIHSVTLPGSVVSPLHP